MWLLQMLKTNMISSKSHYCPIQYMSGDSIKYQFYVNTNIRISPSPAY